MYLQAYITSLVANVPVFLNDAVVNDELLINDKAVLKIGTCSFKFQYADGIFSPLRDENGTHSAKKVSYLTVNVAGCI